MNSTSLPQNCIHPAQQSHNSSSYFLHSHTAKYNTKMSVVYTQKKIALEKKPRHFSPKKKGPLYGGGCSFMALWQISAVRPFIPDLLFRKLQEFTAELGFFPVRTKHKCSPRCSIAQYRVLRRRRRMALRRRKTLFLIFDKQSGIILIAFHVQP